MSILAVAEKQGVYKEISPGEYAGPCPKCGGAMRLKIWPDKNEFKCTFCSIQGGVEEFCLLIGVEVPVLTFDREQAESLMRDLNDSIGAEYPTGALEWLRKERKEVIKSLFSLEQAVDAAYLAEDIPEFKKALDLLKRSYLKAFKMFTDRQSGGEVQGEIFS